MKLQEALQLLVSYLRTLHLYYHNCHNVTYGPTFVSDHDLFNAIYSELAADYDSVSERVVGYYGRKNLSLSKIIEQVEDLVEQFPDPSSNEVDGMFTSGLMGEQELVKLCQVIVDDKSASAGLEQLIGDIADRSEMRQYKLKQRLSK